MKAHQRRSLKREQLAPGVACRHLPKPQSSALHPCLLLLSYLLRPLDCLLFASWAPDDLTPHYVSEPWPMMLPSREPSLARRLTHQKVSGNGSLPGVSLPCWLGHLHGGPRLHERPGNLPQPVDGPQRYPPSAVQSHLLKIRVWT